MGDAGVEKAILIGHSNGVPVVREFYRLYPWRVEGLVAVDGGLVRVFPKEMVAPIVSQLKSDTYDQFILSMMSQMLMRTPEDDAERIRTMAVETPQHVLVGTFEAAIDDETWAPDPIEVPVLAVVAAEAPFWTEEYWERVDELTTRLEIVEIDGVGHFVMIDRPERFNEALVSWVNRGGEPVR